MILSVNQSSVFYMQTNQMKPLMLPQLLQLQEVQTTEARRDTTEPNETQTPCVSRGKDILYPKPRLWR